MRNNLQKTANYPLLDYYPRFLNNIRQWNRRRKLKQHQTGIKITLNRCAFNLIIKKILAELSFILDLLLNHKHRSVYPHGANRRRLSRLFLPFFFLFPLHPLMAVKWPHADYIDIVRSIPPSFYRFASGTKLHHARRNFRRGEKNPLLSCNDRLFARINNFTSIEIGKMKLSGEYI